MGGWGPGGGGSGGDSGTGGGSSGSKSFGPGQAIGGISDLVGLFTGISDENQESGAITQTGNALQDAIAQIQREGSGAFSNYTSNAQPGENAIIANEPGQIQGFQTGAAGEFGQEGSYAAPLAASPYPGMIQSEGGQYMTVPAGAIAGQEANAAALENWHGIQPKELGEATTVASDAALSAAKTAKAQMGGVANPGAAFEQAVNTAAQAGSQTGAQLGSMAEEQELGAKEAAGSELGQVAGEQLQQVGGEVGATEGAGQAYDAALTGAGGLAGAAGQGLSELSEQDIAMLDAAFGNEASMASAGLGAGEYGASDWSSLLESELSNQQQEQNPFSTFASSISSLLPLATAFA